MTKNIVHQTNEKWLVDPRSFITAEAMASLLPSVEKLHFCPYNNEIYCFYIFNIKVNVFIVFVGYRACARVGAGAACRTRLLAPEELQVNNSPFVK